MDFVFFIVSRKVQKKMLSIDNIFPDETTDGNSHEQFEKGLSLNSHGHPRFTKRPPERIRKSSRIKELQQSKAKQPTSSQNTGNSK